MDAEDEIMSEYQPVPVAEAKRISDQYAKSMVVILVYDPVYCLTHTTTYGVSAFDKENAAASGEIAARALGSDLGRRQNHDDFHDDYSPALYREALEILKTIRSRNGTTPVQVQQIERLLKAAGNGVRQG
jgi:hypothetical protein